MPNWCFRVRSKKLANQFLSIITIKEFCLRGDNLFASLVCFPCSAPRPNNSKGMVVMTTLKIVTYPDQLLTRPTKPVENIDQSIQDLIEKMAVTMYEAPGVGLAAIQVGIDKSIVVYDESPRDGNRDFNVLINPKIIRREGEILSENEGCLSVPDFTATVTRAAQVTVEALDREGKPLTIDAEDLLAIILQHEIDHLNGILFVDRLSALKRELFKRRVRKQLKRRGVA